MDEGDGKYMRQPLLSLERLSLDEREAKVCDKHGKEAQETKHLEYLEFIAQATSHRSDRGQVALKGELTSPS